MDNMVQQQIKVNPTEYRLCRPVKSNSESFDRLSLPPQPRSIPAVLAAALKSYLFFLFTTFAVGLVTAVAKTTLGRLRPNFLDVCRPDYDDVECDTGDGFPNYVTGRYANGVVTLGASIHDVRNFRIFFTPSA